MKQPKKLRTSACVLAIAIVGCGDDEADDAADGTTAGADSSTTGDAPATDGADGASSTDALADDTAATDDGTGTDDSTGTDADTTPIVLVHGAWMGAWAWDDVVPMLEAAGHPTYVVELPAHGEDTTPPAEATLEGYRDAVLTVLDGLDEPAAVVGHSMGGMVITEVAEARPEAIATLVYVAAFLPQSGESLLTIASMDRDSISMMHTIDNGDGTASIDPAAIGEVLCGGCSDETIATLVEETRPEPLTPLVTPATVTEAAFGSVYKTYVHTELDLAVSYAAQQQMVAATPVDDVRTLTAGHSPFLSDPQPFVDTVLELVESGS